MDIKEIERDIYSTFADIASTIGYNEIHGRILAVLLVRGKKMSLQELAKETGYSISTISISLDLLEVLEMIRKVKKAGDRKLYIELHGDLLGGLKKAFLMKMQKNVSNTLDSFNKYKDALNKSKDRRKDNVLKTLDILEKQVKRVDKYVALLSKIRLP